MKYRRKNSASDEISYWESMTDLMSALILIVLLIFALVLLYIVRIPDKDYKDIFEGDDYHSYFGGYDYDADHDDDDHDHSDRDGGYPYREEHSSDGGGGEHTDDHPYNYEYPGITDDYGKAAVHVTVIDAETEKVIEEAGQEFQLYRPGEFLQVLNTYYPKKIEYLKFETTENGTFYLPEKIPGGGYYFHQLTAPEDYDPADNIQFLIPKAYDWNEPCEVTIPLYPSRNIIRVKLTDKTTGEPAGFGEFDVIAAEDIITGDGTLRFSKGQIADHIVCGENGEGESIELYVGSYYLRQTTVPRYYAALKTETYARAPKKGTAQEKTVGIAIDKTTVIYTLRDELYKTPISGENSFSLFPVPASAQIRVCKPDANGRILVTDLDKNTTYALHQTEKDKGYLPLAEDLSFTVAEDGTVDGMEITSRDIYIRKIRVKAGIRDMLLKKPVSDVGAALYDSSYQLVERWDSSAAAHMSEGLVPGSYLLATGEDLKNAVSIQILDTAEIQEFYYELWTLADTAIAFITIFSIILLLALAIRISRKKKR